MCLGVLQVHVTTQAPGTRMDGAQSSPDPNGIRLLAECAWTLHLPWSPGGKRPQKGRGKNKKIQTIYRSFYSGAMDKLYVT